MLHGLVGFCFKVFLCRFKIGARRPREVEMTVFIKDSLLWMVLWKILMKRCCICGRTRSRRVWWIPAATTSALRSSCQRRGSVWGFWFMLPTKTKFPSGVCASVSTCRQCYFDQCCGCWVWLSLHQIILETGAKAQFIVGSRLGFS